MKGVKILEVVFTLAQRGWVVYVTVLVDTHQQFTTECHKFKNTDLNLRHSCSWLVSAFRMSLAVRKELLALQAEPGEYEIN